MASDQEGPPGTRRVVSTVLPAPFTAPGITPTLESNWWTLAVAGPVALYLWLIAAFGVNVVFEDSWNSTLLMLRAFASGKLTLATLWAPHNGNRLLFPNLVFLATDIPSHYNAIVDLYLSAGLMVAALALLCWLVRRTAGVAGFWLLPIAVLLLSPVQIENILWDFQLAWCLTLLAFIATLCCIELWDSHPSLRVVAVVLAVVASFSSVQGLLVWPAGLLYAWSRNSSKRVLLGWAVLGIVVGGIYFWRLGPTEPASWSAYPYHHPLQALRFLLDAAGNYAPRLQALVGIVALLGTAVTAWVVLVRPEWRMALRLPATLLFIGAAFVVLISIGRSALGVGEALSSRYTTYTLLIPTGLYVAAVLGYRSLEHHSGHTATSGGRVWPKAILVVLVGAIALQFGWAIHHGLRTGRTSEVSRARAATALLEYKEASDSALQPLFAPGGAFVKEWAPILVKNHWSVFAGAAVPSQSKDR